MRPIQTSHLFSKYERLTTVGGSGFALSSVVVLCVLSISAPFFRTWRFAFFKKRFKLTMNH